MLSEEVPGSPAQTLKTLTSHWCWEGPGGGGLGEGKGEGPVGRSGFCPGVREVRSQTLYVQVRRMMEGSGPRQEALLTAAPLCPPGGHLRRKTVSSHTAGTAVHFQCLLSEPYHFPAHCWF